MRIRHSNMLAQAHFLRTKAEPRLVSFLYFRLLPCYSNPAYLVLQAMGALTRRRREDQGPGGRSKRDY